MRSFALSLIVTVCMLAGAQAQTMNAHGTDNAGNAVTVVATIVPGPDGAPLLVALAVSINGRLHGGLGVLHRGVGDRWECIAPVPVVPGDSDGNPKGQDGKGKPKGKDNPKPPILTLDGKPSNEQTPGDQGAGHIDIGDGRIRLYN
jgi:hypothetical protein